MAERNGLYFGKDKLVNMETVQLMRVGDSGLSRGSMMIVGLAEVSVGDIEGHHNGWMRVPGVFTPWATSVGIEEYLGASREHNLEDIEAYPDRLQESGYQKSFELSDAEIWQLMDEMQAFQAEDRSLAIGHLVRRIGEREIRADQTQYAFWRALPGEFRRVEEDLLAQYFMRNGSDSIRSAAPVRVGRRDRAMPRRRSYLYG